jgi:hypothetical protein
MPWSRWGAAVVAASVAGCAVTHEQFGQRRAGMSDTQVCRTWVAAVRAGNHSYASDASEEAGRRGVTEQGCVDLIKRQDAAIAAAVVILGVAAIAASKAGGGGGSAYAPAQAEYAWDWDLFYNQYNQLVWACRGIQTGQFADQWRCGGKVKTDARWPSLSAQH